MSTIYYCNHKYESYQKMFEPIKTTLENLGFKLILVKSREDLPKDKSIIRFEDSGNTKIKIYYHSDEKTIDNFIQKAKKYDYCSL